ncbi:GNAT family N-acetyltransferase [Alkalimarinus sediminis]|uniref:GNAT family N-acetyltransferase n=1 Tax=Alkalimarinus sediminis TaxID=1632866 RepID=A0A9E8HJ01_9ALTE|nr:GNAT family N-acetyltransferase [Alkalimarinus sediminis]UZW75250.1 GNAT family N-acetyltransferase [Alkalimarinus sediminis]
MTETYEKLTPIAYPLANRFYKQSGEKGKTQSSDEVYVARSGANIIAAVRLCPLVQDPANRANPSDTLLLRSLAVAPAYRRTGVGSQFMRYVVEQIGSRACWCYPFSWLESFYGQTGFKVVAAEDSPDFIRSPFENYRRQGRDILIMGRHIQDTVGE